MMPKPIAMTAQNFEVREPSLTNSAMFRIELDLKLYFEPLMNVREPALLFTRTIYLPFVPTKTIAIGGRTIEGEITPPLGYILQDIIWDIDHQVFLATTGAHHHIPLAFIPDTIREHIDLGWRLGSWQQKYDSERKSPIDDSIDPGEFAFEWEDESELEDLETKAPRGRPQEFNRLLSALARLLVQLDNNRSIAYAIYKTKTFFPINCRSYVDAKTGEEKVFRDRVLEFDKMEHEQKSKAVKAILRNCERLTRRGT